MPGSGGGPRLSVVVPTYNRADLLSYTLRSLVEQTLATDEFEVVVVDDGSSDGTHDVVRGFAAKLRLNCVRLERDAEEIARLGHCLSRVRNHGVAAARGEFLVFADTGVVAGPTFLAAHLAAQTGADAEQAGDGADSARGRTSRVVVGYTYGTKKLVPYPPLAELLATRTPVEVAAAIGDGPLGLDARHREFLRPAHEVRAMAGAWAFCWGLNFSVSRSACLDAGGFDEDFRGWGCEDLEFSYRMARRGAEPVLSRQAWALEWPTPQDVAGNSRSSHRNFLRFLAKHRHPDLEIWCDLQSRLTLADFQRDHDTLREWTATAHRMPADDDFAAVERRLGTLPPRIAVLGCGAGPPPHWPAATLFDFDPALLDRATAGTGHTGRHGVGLATGLPDDSVDLVVVTSRLAGLWPRWGEAVLAEAHRVGGQVVVPFLPAHPR